MALVETPKVGLEYLRTLVELALRGRVVVPEAAPPLALEPEEVRELIVLLLQGSYIGTFLTLETPIASPVLPFKLFEGAFSIDGPPFTAKIVLEGQKEIASMIYAFRRSDTPYRFYLHLDAALDGRMDEAVAVVPAREAASLEELVKAHRTIPLPLLQDDDAFFRWLYDEQTAWSEKERERIRANLYERLNKFMVPVVSLPEDISEGNLRRVLKRLGLA